MIGHLVLTREKGRRPPPSPERVLGLTLLRVEVPLTEGLRERAVSRRLDRAARLLAESGCRRVLTEEGFDRWEALRARGLVGVEPSALCQILAAPLALRWLEKRGIPPGRATVALRGTRVSRPLFQAALALAPVVRALCVCAPIGGEELAAHLRREQGLAVLGAETPANLTLDFSEAGAAARQRLRLYPPVELSDLRVLLKEGAPAAPFEPLPLAAALWEAGALLPSAFEIT